MRRIEGASWLKWLGALVVAAIVSVSASSHASAETRTLKLYFIHTKERAEITYKRNGRYDQAGLQKINRFLRDWRRNETAKMDPRLLDLVWSVYQSVGARDYIHVVSAYRSPATNSMLRKRSSGVAEKSQHMLGKAMDFYIPGVKLSKLRAAAFKAEGGGVGYYPKSGSPFVHLDVGNVRSWPRMSRGELLALFPDGKTIHVPSDGKPLPGFKQALAAYEARKARGGEVQVASSGGGSGGRGFLAALFRGGGGADEEEDSAPMAVASAPAAQAAPVAAAAPEPQRDETPETIIAALPAREVPLPGVAPRPLIDIGAPATALIPELVPAPDGGEPEVEVALNVPVPTRRPDYAPEVAAPVQVAAADAVPAGGALAAIAGTEPKTAGSEAIAELLAMTAAEARADVVINPDSPPVPGLRPQVEVAMAGTADSDVMTGGAADVVSGTGDVFVLASLPSTDTHAGSAKPVIDTLAAKADYLADRKTASLAASPREAVLGRKAGSEAVAALDSGVRTTEKSAKPRASQAKPDPKAVVMPVQQELTRWALEPESVINVDTGTTMPSMAYNLVRTAPRTVYTAGFQQDVATADAHRFTGKAVTFLSVAKFETN